MACRNAQYGPRLGTLQAHGAGSAPIEFGYALAWEYGVFGGTRGRNRGWSAIPRRPCVRVRTKRIYEKPARSDGRRILIDRLWPRGLSKDAVRIDFWARSVAPSNELRRWYQHDPSKWDEFRRRYFAELDANPKGLAELRAHLGSGAVTLLFASKEEDLNNARALLEYLEASA